MRNTGHNTAELEAIDHHRARLADLETTLDRLNALSNLDWVVNAEALELDGQIVTSFRTCAQDGAHSRGTVAIAGHDDLICPDCAEKLIRSELAADARIDADVLL